MAGYSDISDYVTDDERNAVCVEFARLSRVVNLSLATPGNASPCAEPVAASTPCTEQSP